jgi:hypothetical protein
VRAGSKFLRGVKLAVSKEKEFELEIRIVVSGYGKQQHWGKLGKEVKKLLAVRLGNASVEVTRVRVPGGAWYDSGIGEIPAFDYEGEL